MMTTESLPWALPIPSTKKVAVSSTNTANTAPLVRNAAIDMYAVKMPHAIR